MMACLAGAFVDGADSGIVAHYLSSLATRFSSLPSLHGRTSIRSPRNVHRSATSANSYLQMRYFMRLFTLPVATFSIGLSTPLTVFQPALNCAQYAMHTHRIDVQLDGVKFCTFPSGLHLEQHDVAKIRHSCHRGVCSLTGSPRGGYSRSAAYAVRTLAVRMSGT